MGGPPTRKRENDTGNRTLKVLIKKRKDLSKCTRVYVYICKDSFNNESKRTKT